MKKRLWRLISFVLIFALGFAGPLGQISYAVPVDYFNFDLGTTPYIEFENTSPAAVSIDTADQIHFTIEGNSLTGTILGDGENAIYDFIKSFAVQLTNQDTGGSDVPVLMAKGSLYNNNELEVLEMMVELSPGTLLDDTLYRLDFLTPTVRMLLNRIGENIYTDTVYDNVRLDITTDGTSMTPLTTNYSQYNVVSGGAIATIKEFGGTNVLTMAGPTLSMDLGDVTGYDAITKLEFRLEGNDQISGTPTLVEADINGGSTLSGTYSELNASPFVYSIVVNLSGPLAGSNEFTIELDDASMNDFTTLINNYIHNNPNTGNAYVLGYNSSDEVVAYNLFIDTASEVLVDPTFLFDPDQTEFTGYYDGVEKPDLYYMYTGLPGGSELYIDGSSSYDFGQGPVATTFFLDLFEYQSGDYKATDVWFEDMQSDGLPDGVSYNTNESHGVIPVNIFERNTIVLSHDNQAAPDNSPYTTTVYWQATATDIEDYLQWSYLDEHDFGANSDIEVIMQPFNGDIADLSLEIIEVDLTDPQNPLESKLVLYEAAAIEPFVEYDDTGVAHDKSLVTFSKVAYQPTEYLGVDAAQDPYSLRVNLIFNNSELGTGMPLVMLLNDTVSLDSEPPRPFSEMFEGVEGGIYYFVVNLEDEVDVNNLSTNKDKFLDLFNKNENVDLAGVNIVSVEGLDDPSDPEPVTDGIYKRILVGIDDLLPPRTQLVFNAAVDNQGSADLDFGFDSATNELIVKSKFGGSGDLLFHVVDGQGVDQYVTKTYQAGSSQTDFTVDYFFDTAYESYILPDEIVSGSEFFTGIADINGNAMYRSEYVELFMETRINSYLVDSTGNYILNAELRLIPTADIPLPVSGSAITWDHMYHLTSDGNGQINGSVYPGSYLAFELSEKDDEGRQDETSIDLSLLFPVRSSDDPYTDPIMLPADNVQGTSLRTGGAYEEDLIFIETQYLDELQAAMTDMENWELFDVIETFYIKEVTTDADGTFSTYLRPGDYTLIGKFEGEGIIEPEAVNGVAVSPESPYQFTVDSTGAVITGIEFPPPTAYGVITDSSGSPLSEVFVEVKGDNGAHFETLTDENGLFNLAIDLGGNYALSVVRSDWDSEGAGLLFIDETGFDTLSITDDQIAQIALGNLDPINMETTQLPTENFSVQFQVDGSDVGLGEYSGIEVTQSVAEGEEPPEFHINSRTGGFSLYLPSGDYSIEGFNYGEQWIELDTALDFNIPTTASPLYIELSEYYNAVITVLDEAGAPLEGYRINVENFHSGWHQSSVSNSSGDAFFDFDVPEDGSNAFIQVNGYEYNDKWYNLFDQNLTLEVNNTHGGTNKASLVITVQKPNFSGQVYYSYPDQQIMDGHLDIKWKSDVAGEPDQYYNVWINHQGDFTLVLPRVGTYVIESAGAHFGDFNTSWFEINKTIEVINAGTEQNPRLVVVEPGTTTEITMPMTVTKAQPNFSGYLYKSGQTPYLATVDPLEFYVSMIVRQANVDPILLQYEPWKYEYRVQVDQTGYFEASLDSSYDYEVVGVESSRGWFEFSTPVAVTLSEDSLSTITAPTPNVNGFIAQFDGTPITGVNYGRVEFEKSDGTFWTGADIDDAGNFGIALNTGDVYTIREYWYETEPEPGVYDHTYVRLDREITVGTNTDQITLSPNFKIDLSASADILGIPTQGTQEYTDFLMYNNYFNANLRPVLTSSDFADQTEYELYLNNPWEFGLWIEGKYDETSSSVEFYSYLEPGTYELMDINGMNLNVQINEQFTLDGSSSTGVAYETSPDRYTLSVNYSTNVTGTILENGQPVAHAWVNFMRTDLDWEDYSTNRWYGTKTDAEGQFAMNLPSDEEIGPTGDDESTAEYKLEGYNTEGHWEGYQWIPGKWSPIGYKFQINSDGELTDTSGNLLDTISIVPNVTGEVYKLFKDYDSAADFITTTTPAIGDVVQVKQAWLSIWPYDKSDTDYQIPWHDWEQSIWTETDPDTGTFSLMLDPGDYIVTDVSMNNFWFNPEIVFTIDSNGDLVDEADDAVESGVLVIKPETPNFSGTAYTDSAKTQPLKWGWIMARPADSDPHDWESTVWINTDQSGYFEMKLDDGDWIIVEMGNYNTWTRVKIPISVSGSTVTSSITGMITNGVATLYPPEPNLQGYVENKSGAVVSSNAWLTIKPAEATDYEWEDAIWTEYKLQSDGTTYLFKANIDPGEYKVVEVGGYDFFYQTDVRFTVNADGSITSTSLDGDLLVVAPPQPNLTGIVYGDTDYDGSADDVVGNGWIGIARFEDGVQVTMEGESIPSTEYKDEWSNMYWQFTRWTETNSNGKYEMNLPTGSYRVIGVGGQGVWYAPKLEFEIESGEVTILDITEPGPNVTITIAGVPTEMQGASYAWLDVFRDVDGMKYFEPVEFKESSGSTFTFEGNLTSGSYTIGFFGTELGGLEIDDDGLTVEGGSTEYTVNVGVEEGSGKQVVTGQILQNGEALGQKAWIKIEGTVDGSTVTKKTQTNTDGDFKFKLPDNTDWTVTEISLKEGYLLLPDSASYQFNTGTDESPSAAWDLDIGSLLQ